MRHPRLPRGPDITVTPAGWASLGLAALGWGVGALFGWTELLYIGASATVVVGAGLLVVLLPRRATATVTARPDRTSAGTTTRIELEATAGLLPLPSPVVRLEGDVVSQQLRMPTLWPRRPRHETFEYAAPQRGIFALGPVLHRQSDPLGLFRRTRRWGEASTLWVRPRVVVPETLALGGVFDLEGLPSDQISMSDLAFHALREYVPGDDLRNVHWRSSAKADTLLVKQYLESRSLRAVVVVDDDPRAYADPDEFEIAVSVAASVAVRALSDGFEIDVACGRRVIAPSGREMLLDECCAWGLAVDEAPVDLAHRAARLASTSTSIGMGIVVSGSTGDLEQMLRATASFGGDASRIAVCVDPAAEGVVRTTQGVRVLEIARLDQLPQLATWAAA